VSSSGSSIVLGGSSRTFTASGGTSPYSYSIDSGGGTIDSTTGAFTADPTVETVTIKATDAHGDFGTTEVTVLGAPGLWLKADTGVTDSSGAVSAWDDQSGNGNNFTQSNGAMQPTLATYNSFPAIQFNGTTKTGLAKTNASNLDLSEDSSVFFVLQTSGCAGGGQNVQNTFLFQGTGNATAGNYYTSAYCHNAGAGNGAHTGNLGFERPWILGGTPSTATVGYASGTPLETGSVFTTIVDNSVGTYYAAGASAGSIENVGAGSGSSTITTIGFIVNGGGVNTTGGSNDYFMNGYILEVLAYTSALTSSRSIVECYLSNKYNLGLSGC
jgi:hypothetical protein